MKNKQANKPKYFFLRLGAHLFAWILLYFRLSMKFKVHGLVQADGTIIGLWHGQLTGMLYLPKQYYLGDKKKTNVAVLISDHRDGELLDVICRDFGWDTRRGDSRRKPLAGLRRMLRAIKDGQNPLFAMDGPVGPAKEMKSGIIMTAMKTEKPIQLVLADANKKWTVHKSWDKVFIPKPFSTMTVLITEPWYADKTASQEENLETFKRYAIQEEEKLNKLTH